MQVLQMLGAKTIHAIAERLKSQFPPIIRKDYQNVPEQIARKSNDSKQKNNKKIFTKED
jgi:hypothetical protein